MGGLAGDRVGALPPEGSGARSCDVMVTEPFTLFPFRQFCTGEFRSVSDVVALSACS